MIGDKINLLSLKEKKGGNNVIFGNNALTRIKGKCIVNIDEKTRSQNMLYVEGLKNNPLSVSQMCDNGYNMKFKSKEFEIHNMKNGKLVGKEIKTHNNVYVFDESNARYYLSKMNEAWLWHKRLCHMNFDSLIKVSKMVDVRALPRLSSRDNSICKSCQFCKNNRTNFKSKEFSSSRPMELIHTDICGPTREKTPKGEIYFMVLIDDFTRTTYIVFLKENSK